MAEFIITKSILKLISGNEIIIIDACDGSETLMNARDVFKASVDNNFENWGTNKPGEATKDTVVQIHEIKKDAVLGQIFDSLGTDLDKLCLTQHQIKMFCKKHASWLHTTTYATSFLFKVDKQFFVAVAGSYGRRLYVHRFEADKIWYATRRRRLVTPKLIA